MRYFLYHNFQDRCRCGSNTLPLPQFYYLRFLLLLLRSQATGGEVLPDEYNDENYKEDKRTKFIAAVFGIAELQKQPQDFYCQPEDGKGYGHDRERIFIAPDHIPGKSRQRQNRQQDLIDDMGKMINFCGQVHEKRQATDDDNANSQQIVAAIDRFTNGEHSISFPSCSVSVIWCRFWMSGDPHHSSTSHFHFYIYMARRI